MSCTTINFCTFGLAISGGNRFIFELANGLSERNYFKVSITNIGTPYNGWFGKINAEIIQLDLPLIIRLKNKVSKVDIIKERQKIIAKKTRPAGIQIATFWPTAEPVSKMSNCKKFYLVQHYEPIFYPQQKTLSDLAEESYTYDLRKLCVSHWLTEKVNGEFLGNGISLKKFKNINSARPFDVMVIPRTDHWKGKYDDAILQLESSGFKILEAHKLSEDLLLKAYNSSKVFLYLSEREGFGYPPLEAMACGCTIVSTPCTEFLNKTNSVLVRENCPAVLIHMEIIRLLHHKEEMQSLTYHGQQTAQQYDINLIIDRFEKILLEK